MSEASTAAAVVIGLWTIGLVAIAVCAAVRASLVRRQFRKQYESFQDRPEQDVISPVAPEYREGYRRWLQKVDADEQEQERNRD